MTRVLAGPYCTMLLADLGADVIKVENPNGGDDTRQWVPPGATSLDPKDQATPESAYFLAVNRGKRSLTLNIKSKQGREIAHRLVQESDVLVENYIAGKLAEDSIGLGYEQCKALNERLIYCSLTGYGQTGPYSKRPGYDVMIEAEAGLMHITGEADRPGVKVGVAITDLTTGMYAHGAIMAALLSRAKTGQGCWIDVSLLDSQIASLANIASNWLVAGQEAKRTGTAHPSIVPYQTFPTKDGDIMVGAGNNGQFRKLCALLGGEATSWPDDARYATNPARVANRDRLIALLSGRLMQHPTSHWLHVFLDQGFPFAPINNIAQTFSHPQVCARGMVSRVDHARSGPIDLVSPAVVYNGRRMTIERPPPVLGQHTSSVLSELGYGADEIARLCQEGIIST